MVSDSPEVWNDDEIELGFYAVWDGNPAGGDTHQYTINADGRVSDFGDPTVPIPVEAAAVAAPGGWNVEVRIPAAHLFGFYNILARDTALTFNLGLHDDDDGGPWDSYLVWQGDSTVGGVDFGEMVMVAIGGPMEEPYGAVPEDLDPRHRCAIQSPAASIAPETVPARLSRRLQNRTPCRTGWDRGSGSFAGDVNGDGFDDVLDVQKNRVGIPG